MGNVSYKICIKNQNAHFMLNNFSFSENRAANEIMWKHVANRAGHKWQYGARTLHAWYLRLQMHTQNI